MNTDILRQIEGDNYKKRPDVKVGDTVRLHLKIKEGEKERIQVFEGIVISMQGIGMSKTITVRKISMGVGVERIVPYFSPLLDKIEIVKRSPKTLRAKLYYMRKRIGGRASKISGSEQVYMVDEEDSAVPAEGSVEGDLNTTDSADEKVSSDSIEAEPTSDKMTDEAVEADEVKVESKDTKVAADPVDVSDDSKVDEKGKAKAE